MFGSLNSRGSSRGSGGSWRQKRATASRFLEKNKLKGATFKETGGKNHQKALRKKRKEADKEAREKEKYDLENPKPENALSYLEVRAGMARVRDIGVRAGEERSDDAADSTARFLLLASLVAVAFLSQGLIQNIPKPKTPIAILGGGRKKKKSKKKEEGEEDGNGNEAEEAGEKTSEEVELDNVLKEVEEEAGVKTADGGGKGDGEADVKKAQKLSFFSPISMGRRKPKDKKPEESSPEAVDLAAGEGMVRASVQRELFRKIATTFSPFKRKLKKEAEPTSGSPGKKEDVVLPEIISSPQVVENREERIREGEGGQEGEVPKPKKRRRKKKKKKREEGGEGEVVE